MSTNYRYFKIVSKDLRAKCRAWRDERSRVRRAWLAWTAKVSGQAAFVANTTDYFGIPANAVPKDRRGDFLKPRRAGDGSLYLVPRKNSPLRAEMDALPRAPGQRGAADAWIGWAPKGPWGRGRSHLLWNGKDWFVAVPDREFSNVPPSAAAARAWAQFPVPDGCVEVTVAEYELSCLEQAERDKAKEKKGEG